MKNEKNPDFDLHSDQMGNFLRYEKDPENPYKFDFIGRKITRCELYCILDSLKLGNCVRIPPHSPVGDIYLNFMCHIIRGQNDFVLAKFTNDDRRKFIKIARDCLHNYNTNKDINLINYNSIIISQQY